MDALTRAARATAMTAAICLGACTASAPPPPDGITAAMEADLAAAARGRGTPPESLIFAALDSPRPAMRIQALAYARRVPVPAAIAPIERIGSGIDRIETRFAAEALLGIDGRDATLALSRLPLHPEDGIRRAVCQRLAQAPDGALVDSLCNYLRDRNPEIRQIAANGLKKVLTPDVLTRARRLFDEGSEGAKLAALSVASAFPPRDSRPLFVRALATGPPAVAAEAAETLARQGPAPDLVPVFEKCGNRVKIAQVLARTGTTVSLPGDDAAPGVRLAAHYGQGSGHAPGQLVLLVIVDTLRADHVSAYGAPRPTSRHLDRLARHAALFETVRSAAPWTLASHAAIFTSRYPSELAVQDVDDALPASASTLAEILSAAGFVTAAVTSVPYLSAAYGTDQGFDWIECDVNQPASRVTDRAIPLLQAFSAMGADKAFLFVHYFDPHELYVPPEPWRKEMDPDPGAPYTPAKRDGLSAAERDRLVAAYDGEIAFADQEIGRLLAWVKKLGFQAPEIYVTSDHGEELTDHGKWGHGWTLFEEQQRVPLIVPGAGLMSAPAQLVDLMPTIAAGAGLAPPPGSRGLPLASSGFDGARESYAETRFKGAELASLVSGDRKLVAGPRSGALYDLSADPGERSDRAASDAASVGELRARIEKLAPAGEALVRDGATISPDDLEALRALGYVGN
ncbi:MAG: sulfatase-like hydrolase/transferase [Acidobacteriota bacterium]